jgi:hypothetical protein
LAALRRGRIRRGNSRRRGGLVDQPPAVNAQTSIRASGAHRPGSPRVFRTGVLLPIPQRWHTPLVEIHPPKGPLPRPVGTAGFIGLPAASPAVGGGRRRTSLLILTPVRDRLDGRFATCEHFKIAFHNGGYTSLICKRDIEMTPLCKIEATLPRVLGSREVRRGGGVVDEQAGVRPS